MNRSSTISFLGIIVLLSLGLSAYGTLIAAEHAGEHPGQNTNEHAGEEAHGSDQHDGSQSTNMSEADRKNFGAEEIKNAIRGYITKDQDLKNGYFFIHDDKLEYDWKLTFSKLHPVRIITKDDETIYFACTNFDVKNDTDEYSTLDLDFWMKPKDGELEPYKVRIHKVDGEERFTYRDDKPVQR